LINNRKKWEYKGVLHEYLSSNYDVGESKQLLGDYYIESGKTGDRSKNPNKYYDDAIILKNAFEKVFITDYGLACRYAFYCAQSYKDANKHDESIEWYKKCLDLHNWQQEKYYSCIVIGDLYYHKNDNDAAIKYWLKSSEYDTERIEGIINALQHFKKDGNHILINSFYHKFKNYNKNLENKLFLFSYLYKDELEFMNSISAYYVNDYDSGYDCCKTILTNRITNYRVLKATLNNLQFYEKYIENDDNSLDFFYKLDTLLNDIHNNDEEIESNYIKIWEKLFIKNADKLTHYSSSSFNFSNICCIKSNNKSTPPFNIKSLSVFETVDITDVDTFSLSSIELARSLPLTRKKSFC
jgi:hypothetical protein